MRVYYRNERVTLYHGDCRDADFGKDAFDLIVMDPPYGVEFVSGKRGRDLFGEIAGDDSKDTPLDLLRVSLPMLRRARHVYCFGTSDFGDLPICSPAELVWDKEHIGMGDLEQPWGPAHERVLFGVYEISKANREKGYGRLAARLRQGSVLRAHRKNSAAVTRHPTEKPVSILRQMIEASSVLDETVYDPCAGSGSTLVAALLDGRRAVGVEIDEKWLDTATARLNRVSRALDRLESADEDK
jgi:tRNA G10  N-methylase Trm11